MIVDMDLSALTQDQKSQNIILADRVIDLPQRSDGLFDFIKPQFKARRSNQEEIDIAFGNKVGMDICPAVAFGKTSQTLKEARGINMRVKIPDEVFFHQVLITGKTGSGKTVAMKYILQYFLEEFEKKKGGGAVLAINVKEEDLLTMDKKSETRRAEAIKSEWNSLNFQPHGVETLRVYYPGNKLPNYSKRVVGKNVKV